MCNGSKVFARRITIEFFPFFFNIHRAQLSPINSHKQMSEWVVVLNAKVKKVLKFQSLMYNTKTFTYICVVILCSNSAVSMCQVNIYIYLCLRNMERKFAHATFLTFFMSIHICRYVHHHKLSRLRFWL